MSLKPVPCVTAASEDKNNRSRHELRELRWVAADAETLCSAHVQSVLEITRTTTFLKGKLKGQSTRETILYLCTLPPDAARGGEMLGRVRNYWEIESGLHQRLDVTAAEDASRVRNRNGLLVLGILRRCAMGIYYDWRRGRKNKRQSTLKDFHDDMRRFNNRHAFATITSPRR